MLTENIATLSARSDFEKCVREKWKPIWINNTCKKNTMSLLYKKEDGNSICCHQKPKGTIAKTGYS